MTESERIHLAFSGGGVPNVERVTRSVIDVLVVQKDDDPLRSRAAHGRSPKSATKSPACAGEPGRRGGLLTVYIASEVAQA
jgi:hypothetical protein